VYLEISKVHGRVSDSAKEARHSSKLYVSKGNIRLETNGLTGAVLVVNKEEHTAVALYPGKKSYQPLGSGPSQYFRVENADDACADWQRTAEQKIVCERVGPEMVNGREAVKYQNTRALDTAPAAVWIDKALKFVIKWESADTSAELRNIKEEQQAADLFLVPSEYKMGTPQKTATKGFSHRR
jgi:hypothetical protein